MLGFAREGLPPGTQPAHQTLGSAENVSLCAGGVSGWKKTGRAMISIMAISAQDSPPWT